jgi:hypothetical protein
MAGVTVSRSPAVMGNADAESVQYANNFFAPADAPEHQSTAYFTPAIAPAFALQHTPSGRRVEAKLTGARPSRPRIVEGLAARRVAVRVRDLVRDAAVGRERQGRRIGRAQVQRHAEFSGFGSMLTTVASRNKSRVQ